MTLESEYDYCDVFVGIDGNAVFLQDETGEAVYLDTNMVRVLLPALQHFLGKGALPE